MQRELGSQILSDFRDFYERQGKAVRIYMNYVLASQAMYVTSLI